MAGIYIHIPFCAKKCHYCNFFSLASKKYIGTFVTALCKEIELQKDYLENEKISTIYFGGGTPSLLSVDSITHIINKLNNHFKIDSDVEITIEANPDDLNYEYLKQISQTAINRLSIGIQSFDDADLLFLNRLHSAQQASETIFNARKSGLNNISIDLIYGIPGLNDEKWKQNISKAIESGVQHISAYSLTVESNTAFDLFIKKGKINAPDDETALRHFNILCDEMNKNSFIHYEISNFCKQGFESKHNSNYWKQKKYLGLGPSAHSYNLKSRQWNISNLQQYIKDIDSGIIPFDKEELNLTQRYNEYIMTGLRCIWGVNLDYIYTEFGEKYYSDLIKNSEEYINKQFLKSENNSLIITQKAKFFSDGIASDLFYEE